MADSSHDPQTLLRSASRLVSVLREIEAPMRLPLLKRVSGKQGETGFATFLKLLLIIEESEELDAKQAIADAFGLGLRQMDLPSGDLTAWGASNLWQNKLQGNTFNANDLIASPSRRLDPIQYLVVWFSQKTQRPYLTDSTFRYALEGLIRLMNHNTEAKQLYPRKIMTDITSANEGAYTRTTRVRLQTLADGWLQELDPSVIAESVVR